MDINRGDYAAVVNRCACCGRSIKADYSFCIGCERKRSKVLSDCVGAGMRLGDAERVVDGAYPLNFS